MPWSLLATAYVACTKLAVLQVFSTQQHAIVIVYGYPYFFSSEVFLEHLAEVNTEPTKATMSKSAPKFCPTKAWADLDDYVELVASNILHDYVPLNPEERDAVMRQGLTAEPTPPPPPPAAASAAAGKEVAAQLQMY